MARGSRLCAVADDDDSGFYCLMGLIERNLGYSGVMRAHTLGHLLEMLALHPSITLVVVATHIRGFEGPKSIRKLRKVCPQARLVVFGDAIDRESILSLLAGGIHGFLSRRLPPDDMAAALGFVDAGHITVPSLLADDLPAGGGEAPSSRVSRDLTRRQSEILELLSEGLSTKLIARRLRISPSTVKGHVQATYRALGVHNRRGAAAAFRA